MHVLKSDDDPSIDHFGLGMVGLTKDEAEPYFVLAARECDDDSHDLPIPIQFATPEQFPCIFRESFLEEVPCQVCGQKDKTASVYACALHGKCTVGSHGVTQDGTNATGKVKVCISCDDINGVG